MSASWQLAAYSFCSLRISSIVISRVIWPTRKPRVRSAFLNPGAACAGSLSSAISYGRPAVAAGARWWWS